MKALIDIENRIKVIKEELSRIEITQEIFDSLDLINERRALIEKKTKIKWSNLNLENRIIKRKEDFSLTNKYYEKFREEVEQKYLFKKNYVELIDNIQNTSLNSPLLAILLKSLNTSMYVDFENKDFNILFIIEELKNIETSQLSEMISSYEKVIICQKRI